MATGVFDGVHVGHQAVIREAVRRARKLQGEAVVLTFHPHPSKVLRPDSPLPTLTTEQQDYELFSALDVDICVILDFTEEFSRCTAADFLDRMTQSAPSLRAIVIGPQWHFGHERKGDFKLLNSWVGNRSIEAFEMQPVLVDGEAVSSTTIRRLIAAGDITAANARLGRSYQLVGRVVRGEGLGSKLGFPTANLDVENELVPAQGVYAARALIEGEVFIAAVNIGMRPTLSPSESCTVEAHLLQFNGDLYGHHLRLDFLGRLRDERKFTSAQELHAQIQQDAIAAFHLAHR